MRAFHDDERPAGLGQRSLGMPAPSRNQRRRSRRWPLRLRWGRCSPAGDDQVLDPADDADPAIWADTDEVAAAETAFVEGIAECVRPVPVAGEQVRAADQQFSLPGLHAELGDGQQKRDVRGAGLAAEESSR